KMKGPKTGRRHGFRISFVGGFSQPKRQPVADGAQLDRIKLHRAIFTHLKIHVHQIAVASDDPKGFFPYFFPEEGESGHEVVLLHFAFTRITVGKDHEGVRSEAVGEHGKRMEVLKSKSCLVLIRITMGPKNKALEFS